LSLTFLSSSLILHKEVVGRSRSQPAAGIFGRKNDCNLLLYYFRGQNDCNLLLYLTTNQTFENVRGAIPRWHPLVAGLDKNPEGSACRRCLLWIRCSCPLFLSPSL